MVMKRLAIIAVTGFLALFLTACEDKGSSTPAADTNAATVQQTDENAAKKNDDGEKKGANEAQPSTEGQSN